MDVYLPLLNVNYFVRFATIILSDFLSPILTDFYAPFHRLIFAVFSPTKLCFLLRVFNDDYNSRLNLLI